MTIAQGAQGVVSLPVVDQHSCLRKLYQHSTKLFYHQYVQKDLEAFFKRVCEGK